MEENQVENKIVEPTLTEQPQTAQTIANETEETPQQIDWRKFKEARKQERLKMEEAQKQAAAKAKEAEALKAALDALVNKPTYAQQTQYEQREETEDERLERLVEEKIAKKEKANEEERLKREQEQSFPNAMKTFSDFKDIYTQENCDYLEYHHPELFAALKDEPDSMSKWTKVYNAMKRYIPNAASSNKEMKKAERNMSKPQSMAVGGITSTADQPPRMLNDKVKQDNWKRMQARIKGLA